jgi:VCBS repeat protein
LVDLDGDKQTDILSGSWPGEIYIFRRQPDGSFAATEKLVDEIDKPINLGHSSTVFAVDWNADGAIDLLVGNIMGEVHLVPGRLDAGKLKFTTPQRLEAAGKPILIASGESSPVAADWNADGRLDLISGSENGSVVWIQNVGSAREPKLEDPKTLIGESPFGWQGTPGPREWGVRVRPCVVDYNGDGRLDILLGDRCGYFQAKPTQSEAEKEQERRANDRLPELRRAWTSAFQEYQRLQADDPAAAPGLADVRQRLGRLKDEIARVQEIQERYQPGYQSHGYVWLFLRKPAITEAP